jgi:chromate transporter
MNTRATHQGGTSQASPPSLAGLFFGFLHLGLTSFGGLAMIPFIRRYAVEKRRWIDEKRFKQGVGLSQAIPGATAMQVAAYVGLNARGLPGAFAAYFGFGLPAFLLILALSAGYAGAQSMAGLQGLFAGLKSLVVALILSAAVDCSERYAQTGLDKLLALVAAFWLGFGGNPILAVLVIMAGCAVSARFVAGAPPSAPAASNAGWRPSRGYWLGLAAMLVLLIAALAAFHLFSARLYELAVLMLRVDLFAFGGGYVSVPFMLHEVVNARGWLTLDAFMDGIALGQITPGPIVMTAAFVGYLLSGLSGALVATVYVFAPSFFLLTALAGFVSRLLGSAALQRALHGSLATLVGLLAATAAQFILGAQWRLDTGFLALAAFVALRVGVGLMWVVLLGSGLSWLALR